MKCFCKVRVMIEVLYGTLTFSFGEVHLQRWEIGALGRWSSWQWDKNSQLNVGYAPNMVVECDGGKLFKCLINFVCFKEELNEYFVFNFLHSHRSLQKLFNTDKFLALYCSIMYQTNQWRICACIAWIWPQHSPPSGIVDVAGNIENIVKQVKAEIQRQQQMAIWENEEP